MKLHLFAKLDTHINALFKVRWRVFFAERRRRGLDKKGPRIKLLLKFMIRPRGLESIVMA